MLSLEERIAIVNQKAEDIVKSASPFSACLDDLTDEEQVNALVRWVFWRMKIKVDGLSSDAHLIDVIKSCINWVRMVEKNKQGRMLAQAIQRLLDEKAARDIVGTVAHAMGLFDD